jgi:hypothetical protein
MRHHLRVVVRIWNLPVEELDDQHLLGEHLELHVIWSALTKPPAPGRRVRGWRNHPETRRFEDRLGALYDRHEAQVTEMNRRGWHGHKTPLDAALVQGSSRAWPPVSDAEVQKDRDDLVAHYPGWRKAAGQPPDAFQRAQREATRKARRQAE